MNFVLGVVIVILILYLLARGCALCAGTGAMIGHEIGKSQCKSKPAIKREEMKDMAAPSTKEKLPEDFLYDTLDDQIKANQAQFVRDYDPTKTAGSSRQIQKMVESEPALPVTFQGWRRPQAVPQRFDNAQDMDIPIDAYN